MCNPPNIIPANISSYTVCKVIVDAVNNLLCLRALPCSLGALQSPWNCPLYLRYHLHNQIPCEDSCDLQYLTLLRWEIPHITYRKFNTGISNKQSSQCECTIDGWLDLPWVVSFVRVKAFYGLPWVPLVLGHRWIMALCQGSPLLLLARDVCSWLSPQSVWCSHARLGSVISNVVHTKLCSCFQTGSVPCSLRKWGWSGWWLIMCLSPHWQGCICSVAQDKKES